MVDQPLGGGQFEATGSLFGKYRAKVTENVDPLKRARLKLDVPAVPDTRELWALPCVPYAGEAVGVHWIPPIGAHVWVEFEGGNPGYPIWSGCYWEDEQLPELAKLEGAESPLVKLLRTIATTFRIDDSDQEKGSITLELGEPAVKEKVTLTFDKEGALLTTGISSIAVHPKNGIVLKVENTKITMTKESIALETDTITTKSNKDTTVDATGNLTLKAGKAAALQSGTTLAVKAGSTGTFESKSALTVKAGASGTVQASGNLDLKGAAVAVKGSVVKLN